MSVVRLLTTRIATRSCLGDKWPGTWNGLLAGRQSFSDPRAHFPDWPPGPMVGAVRDWGSSTPRYVERLTTLTRSTLGELRPTLSHLRRENPGARCSVIIASSHGDPAPISALAARRHDPLPENISRRIFCDNFHGLVADAIGFPVPVSVLHGACASGIIGSLSAWQAIRASLTDIAIVVAADCLSLLAYMGFQNVGAMSPASCRPFDRGRDGMTAAEGAVGLIYAHRDFVAEGFETVGVLGGSYNCDGKGIVEPSSDGLTAAIRASLSLSALSPEAIDFIYWHGTGTKRNDQTEAEAAGRIWHASPCPAGTASKGALGHTMGAASAFSIAEAAQSLVSGQLPPVANTNDVEFEQMNLVTQAPLARNFSTGLCVAMGFGGINSALVLSKTNDGQTQGERH